MRLPVDVEQLRSVLVRVALGRGQLDMADQFLDCPQVGASLQEMRGKRMPERMRTDAEPHWPQRPASRRALRVALQHPRTARWPRPGKVRVTFHAPLHPTDFASGPDVDPSRISMQVRDVMESALCT